MKKPYEITHCEYCDEIITLESPPSNKRYENGEIHITEGSILLPRAIVKKNHKKGRSDSHAAYINGHYCGPQCLFRQIKKILRRP